MEARAPTISDFSRAWAVKERRCYVIFEQGTRRMQNMVSVIQAWICRSLVAATALSLIGTASARADDRLLKEAVEFAGLAVFLETKVPGLVIGVVRNGQTAVFGFGKISDSADGEPNGRTILRVGSLTKAFTGQVLASLVANGTVHLTDRLQDRIGWNTRIPERD